MANAGFRSLAGVPEQLHHCSASDQVLKVYYGKKCFTNTFSALKNGVVHCHILQKQTIKYNLTMFQ
jgi:hypothetical protein